MRRLDVSQIWKADAVLAGPWFDLGCDGGDFQGGIEYITENGGIDTEEDYPYLAADDKCM